MDKRLKTLRQQLDKARTEEDVKLAWARHLNLDYDNADGMDLCTQGSHWRISKCSWARMLAP